MAPHSSTLARKIPWMEEPGRLQSMGLLSRIRLSEFTSTFHFHALEKEMATHFSSLAWKIPWTEEPGRLQSMESLRVGHNWLTSLSISLSCIGEGNGNPLQCFCLENPRDGGAIYGVSQSWTQLKQLSSSSSQSLLEISVHFLEHCLENTSWKKVYVNVRFTCTSL